MSSEQLLAAPSRRKALIYSSESTIPGSQRLATFTAIGGVLLVAGLSLVVAFEQFRPLIVLVFLFLSCVAPALSAIIVYLLDWSTLRPNSALLALSVVKAFLLSFLTATIATALANADIHPPTFFLVALLLSFVAIGAAIAVWLQRQPIAQVCVALDVGLVVLAAIVVFLLSPFDSAAPQPVGFLAYIGNSRHFLLWFVIGAAWTAAGLWLRQREGWAFPRRRRFFERLAIVAVGVVILGLYDDWHFVDFGHYAPLVGPAMHALRGGTPMVDTYSQYGFLPWFVLNLAFRVFDPTFGTAAVVVRLVNLTYFAVLAATLCSVTRHRLSSLWFFVPMLIVSLTTHNPGPEGSWNMHALPMTLGGRWLIPATMALLLVRAPMHRTASPARLAILMLGSLAGFDTLALTILPWGYCLLLEAVRLRSPRRFFYGVALAVAAIAIAQIGLVVIVYLATGAVVDYRPYLNLIFQFRPSEDSFWSVPFVPHYALWFPIGLTFFLIMAAGFHRALRADAPTSTIERLVPVAVLGLGPLSYFFGRPQEGTLNIACLLFGVVAIAIAQVVFFRPQRFGPAGTVLRAVMVLAFSFTIADGLEHFMRPLDPSRGNASILRRCFSESGCELSKVPTNIGLALHTQPLDERTKVGFYVRGKRDGRARTEEAIAMLHRVAPGEQLVALLTDYFPERYADSDAAIGLTAFMTSNQWFPWQISSPFNDGRGPLVTERILQRAAKTPSGLVVIASNDRVDWAPMNYKIWQILTTRCKLQLLETGRYHSAFVTRDCTP